MRIGDVDSGSLDDYGHLDGHVTNEADSDEDDGERK